MEKEELNLCNTFSLPALNEYVVQLYLILHTNNDGDIFHFFYVLVSYIDKLYIHVLHYMYFQTTYVFYMLIRTAFTSYVSVHVQLQVFYTTHIVQHYNMYVVDEASD